MIAGSILAFLAACGGPTEPSLPDLTITTSELENGVVGESYHANLSASGGDGSYSWSFVDGSLPLGLNLDSSTGVVSGTPTTVQEGAFTIQVASGDGQTDRVDLSISIHVLLSLLTTNLEEATQGIPYAATLDAAGGSGAHTWSVPGGALPAGLDLGGSSGEISGTPTAVETAEFTVQVRSEDGQTARRSFSVPVKPQVLSPTDHCNDYPAQSIVTFQDADLEAAVGAAVPPAPGDDLTCERVALVEHLYSSFAEIGSLEGIQNLVGLLTLELKGNPVSDLSPLSGLPDLSWLALGENPLPDLTPLTQLAGLDTLHLENAAISDVSVLGSMSGLTELQLDRNSIADVTPLAGLTNLERLDLNDNSITDLGPIGGLRDLSVLNIQRNSISDIGPLASLTNLTFLGLSTNFVGDVSPLSGLTALTGLHLTRNSISDVGPLGGLVNLTLLYLSENSISDISALSSLTSLQQLQLGENSISEIGALSGVTGLRSLSLSRNSVSDIGVLGGLTSLEQLYLYGNQITDVSSLESLTALWILNLGGNSSLTDIQPLLDNSGLGNGDDVWLHSTTVACMDVNSLEARGVTVHSDCP